MHKALEFELELALPSPLVILMSKVVVREILLYI